MIAAWMISAAVSTFYGFAPLDISGKAKPLDALEGRVLLVVNTASQCGYTPQYAGLQSLQKRFEGRGFTVLAFPSDDFGGQEPGSEKEIKEFCELRYKTTFPLFAKVKIKGDAAVPLFRWLKDSPSPVARGEIGWNFEKFLIDRSGTIRGRFASEVEPEDPRVVAEIERLLGDVAKPMPGPGGH